jgi:hypothetical protein
LWRGGTRFIAKQREECSPPKHANHIWFGLAYSRHISGIPHAWKFVADAQCQLDSPKRKWLTLQWHDLFRSCKSVQATWKEKKRMDSDHGKECLACLPQLNRSLLPVWCCRWLPPKHASRPLMNAPPRYPRTKTGSDDLFIVMLFNRNEIHLRNNRSATAGTTTPRKRHKSPCESSKFDLVCTFQEFSTQAEQTTIVN